MIHDYKLHFRTSTSALVEILKLKKKLSTDGNQEISMKSLC